MSVLKNHRDTAQAYLGDVGGTVRLSRSHLINLNFDMVLRELWQMQNKDEILIELACLVFP